ncbi:MAG: PIN domain-containing protein [Dehalococcoidia bacterium]
MSVEAFDTNVFIYYFDETDARKKAIARSLVQTALSTSDVAISYQVVQETLNALTTKFRLPANEGDLEGFFRGVLVPLWTIMPSPALYERGLQTRRRYQLHFYDALVVAGALHAGCRRLLSEDLQHGQVIEGLTIVNPFLE